MDCPVIVGAEPGTSVNELGDAGGLDTADEDGAPDGVPEWLELVVEAEISLLLALGRFPIDTAGVAAGLTVLT